MSVLSSVKLADRITGTYLDDEITRLEGWARMEIERAGVPHEKAISETDNLILDCVIQGVLSKIARDDEMRKDAERAFLYQLDCLRKSDWDTPEPTPTPEPEPEPDPEPDPEPIPDPNDGGDGT